MRLEVLALQDHFRIWFPNLLFHHTHLNIGLIRHFDQIFDLFRNLLSRLVCDLFYLNLSVGRLLDLRFEIQFRHCLFQLLVDFSHIPLSNFHQSWYIVCLL
jgi:hypothetical protein